MKILIASVILSLYLIISGLVTENNFIKEVGCHWELAERSSTLEDKSYHINNFITALENLHYEGQYNALIFKNQSNSFDYNLKAVKSLQKRLNELEDMDPNSFQYQTAIQQITAQEQGEAYEMQNVFFECYFLNNNILCWNWILILLFIISFVGILIGLFIFLDL